MPGKKTADPALRLGFLFAAIYMVSYITRINYGAVISEMVASTGISKELLSLSLTGSFVTYGIGQVISGIAGDRFSPKKLVSLGLAITAGMNLLIPLCGSPYTMLGVWCINGFAQSFMWPPMVKMLSDMLTEEEYKRGTVIVSWGSSVGTIAVYLMAPAVISVLSWQWVFVISAVLAVVTLIAWQWFSYRPAAVSVPVQKEKSKARHLFTPVMVGVMLAIVLQGMLRDGVTTWMPSYISETYQLSTASAILSGVVLPVFSIVSFQLAARLYRKKLKNPVLCAGVFFGSGTLSAVGLYLCTGNSAAMSVLFSALLTGCMHGVNMMLISMVPNYFRRFGMAGTASGVLNACTYIGSASSTYGIALLSGVVGWHNTVLIWIGIALLGTLVCLAGVRAWNRKFE